MYKAPEPYEGGILILLSTQDDYTRFVLYYEKSLSLGSFVIKNEASKRFEVMESRSSETHSIISLKDNSLVVTDMNGVEIKRMPKIKMLASDTPIKNWMPQHFKDRDDHKVNDSSVTKESDVSIYKATSSKKFPIPIYDGIYRKEFFETGDIAKPHELNGEYRFNSRKKGQIKISAVNDEIRFGLWTGKEKGWFLYPLTLHEGAYKMVGSDNRVYSVRVTDNKLIIEAPDKNRIFPNREKSDIRYPSNNF